MFDSCGISLELEFELDSLLETFEAPIGSGQRAFHASESLNVIPIALLLLKLWHTQKLINRLLWTVCLHLFGAVVFVLNVYRLIILLFFLVFVLKVIADEC